MKDDIITIAHGGGGTKTQKIINDIIIKNLGNPILNRLDDSACLSFSTTDLVFTTDSYVVQPIFFPGGNIGTIAVCGTLNDLTMQGAIPRYLSLGLILEEGLAIHDLETIIKAIANEVKKNDVLVVTGDTKVVERGNANGVFINTSGIGVRIPGVDVHVSGAKPNDTVIITGSIGDHGIAVLSKREGLTYESTLTSDVAPLHTLLYPLLNKIPSIHCLRDPTRGGVAGALCDIAHSSNVGIRINENSLPIKNQVRGVCNLLGFDPLNIANEGKAIIVCSKKQTLQVLEILHSHPLGKGACIIGVVEKEPTGIVLLETSIGGERIVNVSSGEELPRIC